MKNLRPKLWGMLFSAFLLLPLAGLYAGEEGANERQTKNEPVKDEKAKQEKASNQLQEAIDKQTEEIRLNPKNATAYYNRGFAYHSQEKYEKAIQDYSRAIELDPRDIRAYNNAGDRL